jgi:hypothetical protein
MAFSRSQFDKTLPGNCYWFVHIGSFIQQVSSTIFSSEFCAEQRRKKLNGDPEQGCQMVYFQAKNTLGKFWRAIECKVLVNFMAIWNILRSFGIFYVHLSIHVEIIW